MARELVNAPRSKLVERGIGDDAAVLRVGK